MDMAGSCAAKGFAYFWVGNVGAYDALADVDKFIGAALRVAKRAEDWEPVFEGNSQWGTWW